jgi:hypothetical protein
MCRNIADGLENVYIVASTLLMTFTACQGEERASANGDAPANGNNHSHSGEWVVAVSKKKTDWN